MKKKMMMLLTTVALVMGLTACGDSTASTGSDAASNSTPSLVVEGTTTEAPAEVTPEPTPEPTAEPTATPAPVYTEVTLRNIQWLSTVNAENRKIKVPLIDGELPDTSLTMAEMYFHVPEGMSVTYEDIFENREFLYGIWAHEIPGTDSWIGTACNQGSALAGLSYYTGSYGNISWDPEWIGDFNLGMSKEEWDNYFTIEIIEHYNSEYDKYYYERIIGVKEAWVELQKSLFVEAFNNYSCDELCNFYESATGVYLWESASKEAQEYHEKYEYAIDAAFNEGRFSKEELTNNQKTFEVYKTDPTGWVDYYMYKDDWKAMSVEEQNEYGYYDNYQYDRYKKETAALAQ